ncbi:MAG: hypothetical protein AABZ31_09890 [Bdellovibrionota bacterium]
MNSVLGIFTSLGVNSTIWIQLGIFLVAYVLFTTIVVKPYYKAFQERQSKTVGSEEAAETLTDQTRELEAAFQRKARELNLDIKDIYDQAKTEAAREQLKIQTESREKSKAQLEAARAKLKDEYNRAREELIKEAPQVGQLIKERLLAKEH